MLYASLAGTFLLTEAEAVMDSPSRRDGVGEDLETQLRLYGCELIQEAGCLLRLPQAVMATGQVLLHRFYAKRSMAEHDVKDVACASLFLACKLEEQQKRARDVVNVFHRLDQRRLGQPPEGFSLASERYAAAKKHLVDTERAMLRELGFILHVDHPHKTVLNYLSSAILDAEDLMQEAWSLTNDSLRTTLCIQLRGEAIACGVIFMAARRMQVPLPEQPAWWELFDVSQAELAKVCRIMAALYQQPKAQYVSVRKQGAHTPSTLASPGTSPAMANGAEAANGVASSQPPADSPAEGLSSDRQVKDSLDRTSKRSRDSEERGSSPKRRRTRSRSGSRSRSRSRSASAAGRRRSGSRSPKRSRSGSQGRTVSSSSGSPRGPPARQGASFTDLPDPPQRPGSARARGDSSHARSSSFHSRSDREGGHSRPDGLRDSQRSHSRKRRRDRAGDRQRHREADALPERHRDRGHPELAGPSERHRDGRDRGPAEAERHRHRHREPQREREHERERLRDRDREPSGLSSRDRDAQSRERARGSGKGERGQQRQQAWAARQARQPASGRAESSPPQRRQPRSPEQALPGPPAGGHTTQLGDRTEAELYEASRQRLAAHNAIRAKEL